MPRLYGYKEAAHSPKKLSMALSAEVAEIVEQLEAALEEFRSVEEVLAVNGDTE